MPQKRAEVAVSIVLVAIVLFFLWEARDWQIRARLAPWTVGFTVLAISLVQLFVATRALIRASGAAERSASLPAPAGGVLQSAGGQAVTADTPTTVQTVATDEAAPPDDAMRRKALFIIAWTVGFCVGLWLLGFRLGAPFLTFGFLRFGAGESARLSVLFALSVYLSIVFLFQAVVGLPFPPGTIFQVAGLQSPDVYLIEALMATVRVRGEG